MSGLADSGSACVVLDRTDDDAGRVDRLDDAVALGHERDARVAGDDALDAGADERRRRPDERHGLALHVRAHERAVGVVVLEERDERRGHRDQLVRRDVHQVDVFGLGHDEVAVVARTTPSASVNLPFLSMGAFACAMLWPSSCERRVELDLVGDVAVLDLAVRRLDEAELVDARVGRQRRDEADVRTFRRLDRADAAVVRGCTSRTSKPARSRVRPPGPRAERRRLCVTSDSGLVWSMNCESCDEPKYSLTTAETGLALMRSCGMSVSIS